MNLFVSTQWEAKPSCSLRSKLSTSQSEELRNDEPVDVGSKAESNDIGEGGLSGGLHRASGCKIGYAFGVL